MVSALVKMRGRMAIRGVVATADVTAGHAQSEVDPPAADAEAVLTTIA
jgi:hypothetical protein